MKTITASLAFLACAYTALAQAPTGTIAGITYDPSGATVAGGSVKLSSGTDGYSRTALTSRPGRRSTGTPGVSMRYRECSARVHEVRIRICSLTMHFVPAPMLPGNSQNENSAGYLPVALP